MPVVNLRVWAASQGAGVLPADDRIAAIIGEVVRIWGQEGVTLVPEPNRRPVQLLQPVVAAPNMPAPNLMQTVPAELRPAIDQQIALNGQGWVDVVLVPVFGQWGQAYTPLVPLRPGLPLVMNAYAPFAGPVVIVAAEAASGGQGRSTRAAAATPVGGQTAQGLLELALANDIAHELGHVFGLWHTSDAGRPGAGAVAQINRDAQHLIHRTLYSQAAKTTQTADFARAQVSFGATVPQRAALTVAEEVTPNDGTWHIVLRGEVVDPADQLVAHNNITGNHVWP